MINTTKTYYSVSRLP